MELHPLTERPMLARNALTLCCTLLLAACSGGGSGGLTEAAVIPADPIITVAEDGNTQITADTLSTQLEALPLGTLSDAETAGLLLMREEEKLARDVYRALFDVHGTPIFNNIADSEQTHTDAVKALLDRYSLVDPVGEDVPGTFENAELQSLYTFLVGLGQATVLDALYVGAQVEELDIRDIESLKAEVVDNDDILLVYDNLLRGSRNHLRAFHRQIEAAGGVYLPQYLTDEAYNAIVTTGIERG